LVDDIERAVRKAHARVCSERRERRRTRGAKYAFLGVASSGRHEEKEGEAKATHGR
jgi:hypothetical protein